MTLDIIGALTPGQIDTVNFNVSDNDAGVVTITLTAPSLVGVEILNIQATDATIVTSLANALALTSIGVTGSQEVSITTTAIALQTNFAVDASASSGDFTFNGTGATTGFSVVGSSGDNFITGGAQIFSVDLSASTANNDIVTVTTATGGTLALVNVTITGFTSSSDVTVADTVDIDAVFGIHSNIADVTTALATGITNLTATASNGIMTFAGTAAATATLAQKITAALSTSFANAAEEIAAFVHAGNTYIVSNQDGNTAYDAGVDLVIALIGVTDLSALGTAAAANTAIIS
ncbi:MAG: hypothetical protein IIC60_09205 [Proteobacteria bacterium]|nr:hypothetical protein [Pseudomonadota bacterium]